MSLLHDMPGLHSREIRCRAFDDNDAEIYVRWSILGKRFIRLVHVHDGIGVEIEDLP